MWPAVLGHIGVHRAVGDRRHRGGNASHAPKAVPMSANVLRILPTQYVVVGRPQRMIERHVVAYRRQWLIVVSGFFEPLFYLLSMRAGLGDLVGNVSVGGKQVPYDGVRGTGADGVLGDERRHLRLHRQRAAPTEVRAHLRRGARHADEPRRRRDRRDRLGAAARSVVRMQLPRRDGGLGLVESWWCMLALPACALIGLTFASIGFAGTTYMRGWTDMDIVTTAMMPLFLFSATFFPISSYGSWAWIVQLSPLYHGVALVRAANAGVWTTAIIWHVVFLATLAAFALTLAARRLDTLLRK